MNNNQIRDRKTLKSKKEISKPDSEKIRSRIKNN